LAKLVVAVSKGSCGGKQATAPMCTFGLKYAGEAYQSCSGHFKQKETPEAREKLRLEMEDQDEERQKKAKKAMEEYDDTRKMYGRSRLISTDVFMLRY
jgi:hypothetical protein